MKVTLYKSGKPLFSAWTYGEAASCIGELFGTMLGGEFVRLHQMWTAAYLRAIPIQEPSRWVNQTGAEMLQENLEAQGWPVQRVELAEANQPFHFYVYVDGVEYTSSYVRIEDVVDDYYAVQRWI